MNEDTPKTADKVPETKIRGRPFKSGKDWNGNKGGRPRGSRSLSTILETMLRRVDKETGTPHEVEILRTTIEQAKRGDRFARDLIFDRVEGKAPQKIDLTTDGKALDANISDAILKVYGRPDPTPPSNLPTGTNS